MMLFNIKQCRWRSVALQGDVVKQRSESLLSAADRRPNDAAGVRTHIETMCSNLKDMARRCASHPVCDPL